MTQRIRTLTTAIATACILTSQAYGALRLTTAAGLSLAGDMAHGGLSEPITGPSGALGVLWVIGERIPLSLDVRYAEKGGAETIVMTISGPGGPTTGGELNYTERLTCLALDLALAFGPCGERVELRFPVGVRTDILLARISRQFSRDRDNTTEGTTRLGVGALAGAQLGVKAGRAWLHADLRASFDLTPTSFDVADADSTPHRFYSFYLSLGVGVPLAKQTK
ncbi:MAG: hypothetical protein GF331_09285 [Chitinivibrionales bacterium]|nr:hypothetical protein [Chitinivibrionales bacterium]